MLAPVSTAEAVVLRDTFTNGPVEAADGVATCRGLAPLQPRCSTGFSAFTSMTTSVSGSFTGQLVCRFDGPHGSWLQYRIEVVAGLALTYTAAGTGLYGGAISLGCEARGPFGAGGTLGGAGEYVVRVEYA